MLDQFVHLTHPPTPHPPPCYYPMVNLHRLGFAMVTAFYEQIKMRKLIFFGVIIT